MYNKIGFLFVIGRLMRSFILVLFLFTAFSPCNTRAQLIDFLSAGVDSTCIADHSDKFLVRAFGTQKFNSYKLGDRNTSDAIDYKVRNKYFVGFGFHYKWVGANISFKLPSFNKARQKDKRFFDLQSYLYLNRIAFDFYALSYKGYDFKDNQLLNPQPPNGLLERNDLTVGNYGVNFQYIFNYKKFSYRAPFIQSQCQLKSAGSFILGGAVHYTRAKADSSIIPNNITLNDFYDNVQFNKTGAFSLGVNGGYAYTQVIGKHFFITASALVGAGLSHTTLRDDALAQHTAKLQPFLHGIVRGATGYNNGDYYIGIQYNYFTKRNNMPLAGSWQQLQTGNTRLTFAKAFKLKKKTVKKIEEIEDAILPDF